MGFGNMKSLPPPSFDQGPKAGLKEWIGPEPEPAFGYDSQYPEEEEHDLLEGLPNWEPKPQKRRVKRDPYEDEWGVPDPDPHEDPIYDSWKEKERNINPPRARQKKGGNSTGGTQRKAKKSAPKKRSPAKKPAERFEDEDIEIVETKVPGPW